KLSSVGFGFLLLIGTPIAYWVTFSRCRWKFLVESVVALPIVLPPTVLGFYVLVGIGSQSPIGRVWAAWSGHGLAFTFEGLVIASVVYSLPFAVQPMTVPFSQVDHQLIAVSSVLAASTLRTSVRLLLPLPIHPLITAAALPFPPT